MPARPNIQRNRRNLMTLISCLALAVLMVGCSSVTEGPPAPGTILASFDGSLRTAFPLDGRRVAGELHIFLADPEGEVEFVEFSSEDEAGESRLIRRDYDAPFTPLPDGQPLALSDLGVGKHVLVADAWNADEVAFSSRAEFEVADEAGAPTDPNPTDPNPGDPDPSDPTDPNRGDPDPEEPSDPEPPVDDEGEIWQPRPGTSWQWQLTGKLDMSVDAEVFDIDLEGTSAATIDELHSMGRRVICYFSAGSYEPWRKDASEFPESVKGKKMDGWDELWLDIRRIDDLAPVMLARMDQAAAKGCDAVEPDNIDGHQNDTGFELRGADQLAYNRWLADAAHERGLAIALKNDLGQVKDLVDHFDFAINEECFTWNECERLLPFIEAGKAVFGVEYDIAPANFCPQANAMNMDFLHKNLNLGAYRHACR